MSVNTSSYSNSFAKEYVLDVLKNLPMSRIYHDRKILSTTCLDIIMIIFLKSDLGNRVIFYILD